jgi:lipoyl(octanoyl) transferase
VGGSNRIDLVEPEIFGAASFARAILCPTGCSESRVYQRDVGAVRIACDSNLRCSGMNKRKLTVKRLGRVEYVKALALQKEIEQKVQAGEQLDTLLLLEHPHTMTIGRRGDSAAVLLPIESLEARGIAIFETNRGGKITYHGDGQVVGYPIINLSPDREDVHRYVRDLEEVLIRTMLDFDIGAFRIQGLTGVHTTQGKVAAIGVHIARWVTTHGFAVNVNTDLSFFDLIVACEGEPVTSMKRLLGRKVDMVAVEDSIVGHFSDVFEMETDDPRHLRRLKARR